MFPLARLHRLPDAQPAAHRRPAVLLHGFMGHGDMMRPLARRLLEKGDAA